MKISTEICSLSKHIGEEKAIEMYAKAGFDCWDFSMFDMARIDWSNYSLLESNHPLAGKDYLAFARKLKHIGLECGIECNQSHAPFPVRIKAIMDLQKRAIECTAEAGGKICIIHPDNNSSAEKNAEMYLELLPFAKECGVKIATENMWNWENGATQSCFAACSSAESFKEHIDIVNDPYLVACLDLGHAEMQGSGDGAPYMIRELGNRLQALHIHDNDRLHDSHQIPFSMNIDFVEIARALKEIDYQGELTLEADQFLRNYDKDKLFEGAVALANSARRIDELIKSFSK
ncbi:MAG: sugar phosphate isomerase/epimerase [Clostridia bacterium]|nr:sugar phosphate isomerase/epimerase [Clostridia bacterium]